MDNMKISLHLWVFIEYVNMERLNEYNFFLYVLSIKKFIKKKLSLFAPHIDVLFKWLLICSETTILH